MRSSRCSIDLDRLEDADAASAAFLGGPLQPAELSRAGPRAAGRLVAASSMSDASSRRRGVDLAGRRGAAAVLPAAAGLRLQSALGLFRLSDRRRARRGRLRGPQHLRAEPHLCRARRGRRDRAAPVVRQERRKLFYVSPFNGMEMGYLFRAPSARPTQSPSHPGVGRRGPPPVGGLPRRRAAP